MTYLLTIHLDIIIQHNDMLPIPNTYVLLYVLVFNKKCINPTTRDKGVHSQKHYLSGRNVDVHYNIRDY